MARLTAFVTGREAVFLRDRAEILKMRLKAVRSKQCSNKKNKYQCPEVFLDAVADRLTCTADFFLDAELLAKFFYLVSAPGAQVRVCLILCSSRESSTHALAEISRRPTRNVLREKIRKSAGISISSNARKCLTWCSRRLRVCVNLREGSVDRPGRRRGVLL